MSIIGVRLTDEDKAEIGQAMAERVIDMFVLQVTDKVKPPVVFVDDENRPQYVPGQRDTALAVLEHHRHGFPFTVNEAAELLGITNSATRSILDDMVEDGLARRAGEFTSRGGKQTLYVLRNGNGA